ncbi:hypothetical protein GCM10029963_23970 [Micromonospora andamanensis]|nr:hypothetical protein Vwe01_16210 [Micromonospora andamanensis]
MRCEEVLHQCRDETVAASEGVLYGGERLPCVAGESSQGQAVDAFSVDQRRGDLDHVLRVRFHVGVSGERREPSVVAAASVGAALAGS